MRTLIPLILTIFAGLFMYPVEGIGADFEAGAKAFKQGNFEAALREWKPLAEQGDAAAQLELGMMYFNGDGVPQDLKTSFKWYSLAAQQGDVDAQFNLGFMYFEGKGIAQDYGAAFKWYKLAAEQGIADAQHLVGYLYDEGMGVDQNFQLAEFWYRRAADQGHAGSQTNLGWMYSNGISVPVDFKKALKWFTLAANQGYPLAQFKLGWMLANGKGVPKNDKAALEWYRLAAEQGYAKAQYEVGLIYQTGKGVSPDKKIALKWHRLAAQQMHTDARYRVRELENDPALQDDKIEIKDVATKSGTPRLASTSDIHFGKYHALVIGNNDYLHHRALKTAVADAKAVKEVLVSDYGFDAKLLLNATEDDIIGALEEYGDRLEDDDNLLIYYAGHGKFDVKENRGYWLPVDAKTDVQSRWIANDDLTAKLRSIAAKHILVVADSCYSGALTRSVSIVPIKPQSRAEKTALIKKITKQRVRVALTSGGFEPVVDGGGGRHSVFAEAFLDALNDNTDVLLGHELYAKIRGPVMLNAPQTPSYDQIGRTGHKAGDFLFVSKQTLQASVGEPTQADVVFWQSVEDSSNVDMLRAYLKRFPNGTFADLALIKIKELEAAR